MPRQAIPSEHFEGRMGGGYNNQSYTPWFPYLNGWFQFAGTSVPYFSSILPAADAITHLRIARDLLFDPREIVLEELFQRDIDQSRVDKEINPYLRRANEVKFFNSFVVVLLPYGGKNVQRSYEEGGAADDEIVAGVKLHEIAPGGGNISWDTSRLAAVIIDGQHRFAAIKSIDGINDELLIEDVRVTSLPVIILLLSSAVGFAGDDSSLLSTVRKIFIDLNRQAKTVSETRNILLDDRDVAAIALRNLLEPRVDTHLETDLVARVKAGRLPLALVDWYSDRQKFDHGLHITTVLALYNVLKDFFAIPNVDPTDYKKAKNWVQRFEELVPTLDLDKHLQYCRKEDLPIFLDRSHLDQVRKWFEDRWAAAFAYVLTALQPYQMLIDQLSERSLIAGQFEAWTALDFHGKAAFGAGLAEEVDFKRLEREIEKVKTDNLAFQVVFQRAFLLAFIEMARLRLEGDRYENCSEGREEPVDYARRWVRDFNDRIGPFMTDKEFFTGSGIRANGGIHSSRTAEKAITGCTILLLSAPFVRWARLELSAQKSAIMEFVHENYSDTKKSSRVDGFRKLRKTYGAGWRVALRRYLQEGFGMPTGPALVDRMNAEIAARMFRSLNASLEKMQLEK